MFRLEERAPPASQPGAPSLSMMVLRRRLEVRVVFETPRELSRARVSSLVSMAFGHSAVCFYSEELHRSRDLVARVSLIEIVLESKETVCQTSLRCRSAAPRTAGTYPGTASLSRVGPVYFIFLTSRARAFARL